MLQLEFTGSRLMQHIMQVQYHTKMRLAAYVLCMYKERNQVQNILNSTAQDRQMCPQLKLIYQNSEQKVKMQTNDE